MRPADEHLWPTAARIKQVCACKCPCEHLLSAPLLHRCVVLFAVIKASELVLQLVLDASSFLTHAWWPAEIASGISSSSDRICQQQLQKEQKRLGPTSACLLTSSRNSGMTGTTRPSAIFSSGLTAIARSVGCVTNVQMAFHTSGRLLLATGHMGGAVLSAQAQPFVSITHLLKKRQRLRCFGMPKRTSHCLQTK